MAQADNKSPPRSSISTWLIFGVLGLAATLCGLVLPQGVRSLQDAAVAIPAPQPPPHSDGPGVSPVGTSKTGETPVLPATVPPANVSGTGVSPVQTNDTLEYELPALPEMPPLEPMFLRLALGTIFVLILCMFTLLIVKRWVRPLAAPVDESKKLRILESLPLGGRCTVFLLQADEAKILVGVDRAGLKTLLPLPQSFDRALAEMAEKSDE